MSKRLFGTDGIRAVAGEYPLDAPTVRRVGAAIAAVLAPAGTDGECRVVLGRDTRESGPWLAEAIAAGLASRGAAATDAGLISTPGLAYVVRQHGFDAGVMISASHNPFRDNGLKVFGADGMKLSDALEQRVEALVLDGDDGGAEDRGAGARPLAVNGALGDGYIAHLEGLVPAGRLRGMRLVVDCANGSASRIAPAVLRYLGAEVTTLGDEPDGRNINLGCGSLHLDGLSAKVREAGADLGLAFDGDADRCLAVDRQGRVVDGDYLLFITGCRMHRRGALRGGKLVATIMSNFWLEEALREQGIALERAQVGDKYVLERMLAEDLVLGGEQSGHVIFRELATTGDGVLTALMLLDALADGAEPLERIVDGIEPYPQVQINVRVGEKPDLRAHAAVGPVVREVEGRLQGKGRVVLRYSGTEPVARVMLEGRDAELVRSEAERLAAAIRRELGA
jgi:phosphoglucosamine mutase